MCSGSILLAFILTFGAKHDIISLHKEMGAASTPTSFWISGELCLLSVKQSSYFFHYVGKGNVICVKHQIKWTLLSLDAKESQTMAMSFLVDRLQLVHAFR